MPIIGKERKGSTYSKAAKGIPTEGASTPYKGKSTGKRKEVEENREKRGGACG